ncbi:Phage protein U [Caballeronia glathei]|uniref:Oxidoreductase n=1 Tax=Caballeronia glathei TaxID=60547 RepID=A0A069PK85_9BURK|nr:phage tail protein [Caballeronia glathei]KDR41123.1 oxidoreductase [Caballeronia glathei]CDY77948.1 Phage protein U [Caballeronia glathei]
MEFERYITQAATQSSIATERVRQLSRVEARNRPASANTVAVLQKLATGNLQNAGELLSGASSALSVASDTIPKVGAVVRSFNAVQSSVGSVLKLADASSHPLIKSAADTVTRALGDVRTKFNALAGIKETPSPGAAATSTGAGSLFSGLLDGASTATPHLMTLTSDAGDTFHFNLSTAAFDRLRRTTRYKVASQERLNRQEALQAVSQGGETIALSGVVFAASGPGAKQLDALRTIGDKMVPVQLTTGYGEVLGRWYLQGIDEEQEALMSDGAPRKQTFSLEFGRYGEDYKNV